MLLIKVNRWRRADRACGERQRKASSMFSEFDWFLKADDDTFVIIKNLKALLVDYDTNSPIHFGHHFKALGGFFSGGAGYVLGREALRRFVVNGINNASICHQEDNGDEDVKCM